MLSNLNMWNKIGRIIAMISRNMNIGISAATELFYRSKTCRELHDPETGLYLMGDLYIYDCLMKEI